MSDELPRILHVLPPFGAAGACLDYDADCFEMLPRERVRCWLMFDAGEPDLARGVCPFID